MPRMIWLAVVFFACALCWSAAVSAADNAWSSIGPQGGKATDVELVQTGGDPFVFAGTAGGGIYRTVPGSGQWQRVGDGLISSFIVKITVSSQGTGGPELYAFTLAEGLQRSTDLGLSWNLMPNQLAGMLLRDVAVANDMPSIILAATSDQGVWISRDGGATFNDSSAGITFPYMNKIAMAPSFGSAGTAFAGSAAGMYRTINQGNLWEPVNGGLTSLVITAIAVSPAFASDQTVFVGTPAGLHRSVNGGLTWVPVTDMIGNPSIRAIALAADYPADPRIIIGTANSGAYTSTDTGVTWQPLSSGLLDPTVVDVLIPPGLGPIRAWAATDGHGVHTLNPSGLWMPFNGSMFACNVQSMAVSPNFINDGLVLAGTNRGVFSQQYGQQWFPVPMAGMLPDMRSIAFAPDYPAEPHLFAATLSHGCFRSLSGLDGFGPANDGLPSTDVLTIQVSPDYVNDARVWAGMSASGLYQSLNRGATWQAVPGIPMDTGVVSIAFSAEFAFDGTAFVGDGAGNIHRTSTSGDMFDVVFTQADAMAISALGLSPNYSSAPTIYAGTWGDGLYISRNGGDNWEAVGMAIPSPWIADIWLHPEYPDVPQAIAATLTAGCFRTLDDGFTWEPFAQGLSNPRTLSLKAAFTGPLASYFVGTGGGSALRWDETAPAMTSAVPGQGAVIFNVDEDLRLTFGHAMDPDSLVLEIEPDPGAASASWSADLTQATVSHPPFDGDPTDYTVRVREARDRYGAAIVDSEAPLEWAFTVDKPPEVLAAGMWTSLLTPAGGTVTLLAVSLDRDIDRIEIAPGVQLWDDGTNGDWVADDGLFSLAIADVPAGTAPGAYLVPLTAHDHAGQTSATWPYLDINGGAEEDSYAPAAALLPLPYLFRTPSDPRHAPSVLVAGYWDTRLTEEDGGTLTVLALVQDPDGPQDICSVELLYQGTPVGWRLADDGAGGDWTAGDGLYTAQLDIPSGTPPVRLLLEITAEDYAGNISDPWPYLNVNPLPLRADITANPLSGIVPLEVQFQASVDGGTPPYELFWQFGDGATASGPSALHTYSTPGSYQARLDVSDAAGEASVAAITVHAVPSADLTADFTVTPAAGPGPFELVATATGGVPPYAFAWTFGDGSAGEGQRVTHNYETAGTKAVELTVSDADGNTARAAVEVDVGFPSPLEVTVEADPPAGEPPLSVLLRAAVVNGQPPFVYSWELDTGLPGSTYGNADEIRHSFPAGQFDVVVTVTDSLGAVGNATVNIQAEDLPQCDHLAGTEANIEPGPPLTVVYRVSLQDIQVGDEARMEYFEDGAETPCFFGNQRFSFPFTEIELILSLNALPAGCGLASGSQGRFQLTYNGVLCPESVREVRIP